MAATGAGSTAMVGNVPLTAAAAGVNVVRRPNLYDLTTDQWDRFVKAVHTLHRRTDTDYPTQYTHFTGTRYTFASSWQNVPAYFPWHREFLRRFEAALREIDPSVNLPYWEWTADASSPQTSRALSDSMFGGFGGPNGLVTNGRFANWEFAYPNHHALTRSTSQTIDPFYSAADIETALVSSATYDSLRRWIEANASGHFLSSIGGNLGDLSTMFSPNDPLYWVHTCFMDRLWAEWQARNPSLANPYNGSDNVRSSDKLLPFDVTVASTLDTRALGYDYARFSAVIPPQTIP
ncbi:tyrosinase family protein [Streptomyces sp. NPDC127051]|uniref:tyrosinase family protein n=1 Tax=Streptomyces sp. NPDC127051 TaxID=3347119 RepID=UPI0036656F7F